MSAALAVGCATPEGSPARGDAPDLARLELFAATVESEGLRAAWERRPPRPFGQLPLSWVEPPWLEEQLARADASERDSVARLRDRVFFIQLRSDPAVVAASRALESARARRGLDDQLALGRALTEAGDEQVRRQAWLAVAAGADELAPPLVEAARARATWAARRHGAPFLEVLERHRGADPATVARLRRQVAQALRVQPGEDLLDPWNVEAGDPALAARLARVLDADGAERRAREALRWAGLPAQPEGLLLAASSEPGRFADFATYAVDPPVDVRVRLVPAPGLFAAWASLHEMGHAAVALLASPDAAPLARRPASDAVAETCAKVFERLATAPEWLDRHGVAADDVQALLRWERGSERTRVRGILADTLLEDALYGMPFADLDAEHGRLLREVAGVRPVPGVSAWALHRTVAVEPRGRLDYLVARCAQAAIYRRLRALPGGLLGEEAGRVLREDVLATAPGARFEEWHEGAVGAAPSCDAWLADVAGVR